MTLAEKLHQIIAEESEAMNRPATGKACPMDANGRHKWQKPWAVWAKYMAAQRCACGALPPAAAYPEM